MRRQFYTSNKSAMALALVRLTLCTVYNNVFLRKSFVDFMTSCDAHEEGYISQFKLRFLHH